VVFDISDTAILDYSFVSNHAGDLLDTRGMEVFTDILPSSTNITSSVAVPPNQYILRGALCVSFILRFYDNLF